MWTCVRLSPLWSLVYLVLLLAVAFAAQVVSYFVGEVTASFYHALIEKDAKLFAVVLATSLLLICATAILQALLVLLRGLLSVHWRKVLTTHIHDAYIGRRGSYLYVNRAHPEVDNPDQRASKEVFELMELLCSIIDKLVVTPFILLFYTYRTFQYMGILGPLAIYLFYGLGALVNRFFMDWVGKAEYAKERQEGHFRYQHVHLRTHCEAVSMYRGEGYESERLSQHLSHTLSSQHTYVWRLFLLNLSVNGMVYAGAILDYVLIGIPIFMGYYNHMSDADLAALISFSAYIVLSVIGAFSTLVSLSQSVSTLAGYVSRVGELMQCMHQPVEDGVTGPTVEMDGLDVVMRDVHIYPPHLSLEIERDGSFALVRGLSLAVRQDQNLLIVGPSGSGKTSIVRVLCGIWSSYQGSVHTSWGEGMGRSVMFLSQDPYLPLGSLGSLVTYPQVYGEDDRKRVIPLLDMVGLSHLLAHYPLGREESWSDILSPGEQQRVCMARVMYTCPDRVILDECTSHVSESMEARLYTALDSLSIQYISIGHRHTLRRFHQLVFSLDPNED